MTEPTKIATNVNITNHLNCEGLIKKKLVTETSNPNKLVIDDSTLHTSPLILSGTPFQRECKLVLRATKLVTKKNNKCASFYLVARVGPLQSRIHTSHNETAQ